MDKNKQDQNKDLNNEDKQKKGGKPAGEKQEQPLKKHGIPEDPEERRNGGMGGAENFKRNMGCGG